MNGLILAAVMALGMSKGVPTPQPVKSSVEITALYYPGTEQRSEWDMVAQTCPERKPLLGWYDEGNPEAIDWQIKWAVEHGITSFCVDWYWNKGYQRLTHWVKGFQRARYRKYLKWYMMYANHNQPGAHSTADQIAVTKYWIDHYFKTPEYYTIDGKPVVCYWQPKNLDRDFIAEAAAKGEKLAPGEGVKRALAISERLAKEAGLPGIHWQLIGRGTSHDSATALAQRDMGFSSAISYGFDNWPTYDLAVENMPKIWQAKAVQSDLPWWVPLPTGWDDRPRSFANARIVRDRTPEKFAAICRKARQFCDKNGIRHVIVHPINEWQEGSYIEPNEEFGFGMYDAIRDAFCERPAKGWPKNLKPSDVGLGSYDFPESYHSPVQTWNFDSGSMEGWYRQPYGGGELEVKDGALNFWITRLNNYNIRQCVQPFAASKYSKFRIRMRITPNLDKRPEANKSYALRLKWGTPELPIIGPGLKVDNARAMVSTRVRLDGEWHEYEVPLASHPDWKGKVDELWFEACALMHARVAVDWMRFDSDSDGSSVLPKVDIVTVPGELNALLTGGHVQGFTCSSNSLYLSQAQHLVKLDWQGHVLKVIDVPSHLGDISFLDGRIYGAFGLRGKLTGGLIRMWDEDLVQLDEVALPEGTGAVCATPDGLVYSLGMGAAMKKPHRINRLGRMTLDLKPIDVVDVDYGYSTLYGVQSMGWCADELICTFYGVKTKESRAHPTARFDRRTLKALGADTFKAGEGFDFVPPSRRLSSVPEVLAVRAMNGNCKKWTVANPPQVRLERWRYENGRFRRMTNKVEPKSSHR